MQARGQKDRVAITRSSVGEEEEPRGNPNTFQASGVDWLVVSI